MTNTDFFTRMDPYAIIACRTQVKKSSVARGAGSNPKWNETFLFTVTEGVIELHIKLMEKDTFTADDFVGEATIPLGTVFDQEDVPPTSYNVVKDGRYCGEIKVGLNFVYERIREIDFEERGGWK